MAAWPRTLTQAWLPFELACTGQQGIGWWSQRWGGRVLRKASWFSSSSSQQPAVTLSTKETRRNTTFNMLTVTKLLKWEHFNKLNGLSNVNYNCNVRLDKKCYFYITHEVVNFVRWIALKHYFVSWSCLRDEPIALNNIEVYITEVLSYMPFLYGLNSFRNMYTRVSMHFTLR